MYKNWLIKISDASITFGEKKILCDISWNLEPATHWAVFGPNGAGKSTFLRMLRGEVRPNQRFDQNGNIEQACMWAFDGKPDPSPLSIRGISSLLSPEIQRHYVRQGWNMSGEDVILSGFSDGWMLYTTPTEEELSFTRATATSLGAEYLLDAQMLNMSQGQLRLILLARAMVKNPRLLLLDEACDGLDSYARTAMFFGIDKLAESGCSIVYVTHRPEEMPSCLTNYMKIGEGRITRTAQLPPQKQCQTPTEVKPGAVAMQNLPFAEDCTNEVFSLHNVDVYLNHKKILNGLNWQICKGRHWLLKGPNGSGKTTLMRLILGQEQAALGGKIIWRNEQGQETKPTLEERHAFTGHVSDWLQNAFDYEMTGLEMVISGLHGSVGLYRSYTVEEENTAFECLKTLHLENQAHSINTAMSEGTFRRFLLARAIVVRPKLLLLDEPCSGLDMESRKIFLQDIRIATQSDVQIIFVSHSPEDIKALDGVLTNELELQKGRIVYAGNIR